MFVGGSLITKQMLSCQKEQAAALFPKFVLQETCVMTPLASGPPPPGTGTLGYCESTVEYPE